MVDISNVSLHNNFKSRTTELLGSLIDSSRKLSTGNTVKNLRELSTVQNGNDIFIFNTDIERYSGYISNNNALLNTLENTDQQLNQIIDLLDDYKSQLVMLRSAAGKSMNFKQTAINTFESLEQSLNSNFQGKYIFSGTHYNDPAVNDIVQITNLIADQPSTNYYIGGKEIPSADIGDNFIIEYGIKADHPGFMNFIAALHLGLQADNNNQIDDNRAQQAIELSEKSLDQIISLRAQLGTNMRVLSNKIETDKKFIEFNEKILNNILNIDFPSAMVEYNSYTTTIQAAYQMIAKFSRLSLLDYLR